MADVDLYVDNPKRLSRRLFNLTPLDKQVIFVMACVWIVVTQFWLSRPLLKWPFTGCEFLLLDKGGLDARNYLAMAQWLHGQWLLRVRKGIIWLGPEYEAPRLVRLLDWFDRLLQRNVEPIPYEVHELDNIGLVHNKKHRTDSIVVVGTGSPVAAQSLESQRNFNGGMENTTKHVATRPEVSVGASFVFRIRPTDPLALLDHQAGYIHPDIAIPVGMVKLRELLKLNPEMTLEDAVVETRKQLSRDDQRRFNLHLNMLESNRVSNDAGVTVTMATVLTIHRYGKLATAGKEYKPKRRWQVWRRKPSEDQGLYEDEVHRLPIVDIAQTCVEGLEAIGVTDVHVLDPDEVRAYLREAWDVTDLRGYLAEQRSGTAPELAHWPRERIEVTRDTITFDNTSHAVLRVTELPSPSLPHFMRQLYAMHGRWPTISLVGETIKGTGDYFALGRAAAFLENIFDVFGMEAGYKTRKAAEALNERQEQVANSRYLQLYNVLIGLAAPAGTPRLEQDVYDATRDARPLGIAVKRIKGASRQLSAALSVGTGINLL